MDMNEITLDDKSLDYIIKLAEQGRELTDDELVWLMADKERLHVYGDMLGLQQAVCRSESSSDSVDVNSAWEHFKTTPEYLGINQKSAQQRKIWLRVAGIAATVLLLFGIGHLLLKPETNNTDNYIAFQRDNSTTEIVLDRGDGREINLGEKLQAPSNNAQLIETTDGSQVLDYQAIRQQGLAVSNEVESHTVTIPLGKDFRIVLADGTQVWLYAGSRITYPSYFVGRERKVVLHGQAYFKVAKDQKHPFVILTDQLEARVLGTELNVRSYANEMAHVALISGKVEVKSHPNSHTRKVTLKPGQGVTVNNAGTMDVKEENMDSYVYWLNGYIYFDDAPLSEIVEALGHWYNVNVVFEDKKLMQKQLRFFCLRSEPLNQAVDLLNDFGGFRVRLEDDTLIIK